MCGIAGVYHVKTGATADRAVLTKMVDRLRHRGPDERGYYIDGMIGLGQCRLSIIDLDSGRQPVFNEDRSVAVVFNGEIFNYLELRDMLEARGHRFYTKSDTEVLVHCYEEFGLQFLQALNGQFAIALWDGKERRLVLARDRLGIRPLFYSQTGDGSLVFASEIKSLLSHPQIEARIDPFGVEQVFTTWVAIPPRTVFDSISELPPASVMVVTPHKTSMEQYWKLKYPKCGELEDKPLDYYCRRLEELLDDAVALRLRADVPVASYLSGGIDSSIISTIARRDHHNGFQTFSVVFSDPQYDERTYQYEMVKRLDTRHVSVDVDAEKIGASFADVVYFAEKPLVRTAPAPLFLLSQLVRQHNIKVVLTGEGADEFFGGYNIFKEDKIRRFWAESPSSRIRPLLLLSLYPYIDKDPRTGAFWQMFFKRGLTDTEDMFYSHQIRWHNTSSTHLYFRDQFRQDFSKERVMGEIQAFVDSEIMDWHPLCRAQYLEATLFMSGYLLSSQGDRMMMGHSVEGRFPFLDHRLVEFSTTIPPKYKLRALNEKYILKQAFRHLLPSSVVNREKQPYRAPISQCFRNRDCLAAQVLTPEALIRAGYFDPQRVNSLLAKINAPRLHPSARDDMALVGIASMQLLHHHFVGPLV